MKMLKMLAIVVVLLTVCAPSFGYILIYNTFGRVKAVDSQATTLNGIVLRGYMILDINNADGEVNDVFWICYGKDTLGAKVYTESVPNIEFQVSGKYQTLFIDVDAGWTATVLGKMSSKAIGLADRKTIAYTMSGNLVIVDSTVFDATQLLRGGGSLVVTLNSTKTKAANTADDTFDDVIGDTETALESAGYN
jgi:hypothetical protein